MKEKATPMESDDRRQFLLTAASASGLALAGCATAAGTSHPRPDREPEGHEAEVTPGEDLMQEHGVLERILLIYGEAARRLELGEQIEPSVVNKAAGIIRRFVEDYHERLEEEFVFPRLEAAGHEVDLLRVLRRQHERGRELTEEITRLSSGAGTSELARALRAFERMYRPHAAREDTVLFPAFRKSLGRFEYRELGEQFEEREHDRLGEHGFQDTVVEVARLESALDIADLARFTA